MELCPTCKTQLQISNSYIEVEGDKSPETNTSVYQCLTMICKNPRCERHEQVVETIRHLEYQQ